MTVEPGTPQTDPVEILSVTPGEAEQAVLADEANVARATGVIALGNITSRVLGLGREMLLSDLFGAGVTVDAFNLAVIVPKTLYDLLIGGHVNSAIVPVLSEYAMAEDRAALWRLVNQLMGVVVILLAALILLIELAAPQIIGLVASSEVPAIRQLATDLLRVTAPALMFLSLFAVLSGVLYALRRFTIPAFAGAMFNGTIVIVTLIAAPSLGISAMAVGWLVGAAVQMGAQVWGLRDGRLFPSLRGWLESPGLRRIGLLYLPVMFSLVIDTLVIRLVSYRLASQAGPASISYMNFATTLMQFPHGLVATAISIAILPTLSRQAVALDSENGPHVYKQTLGRGLRLGIVLIVPAAIGMFVLAGTIVALLFEHGSFTALDTANTALALRLYLFGLPFAAVDLLLIFAFYSQKDTLTPAIVGVISLVAYMVIALRLMPDYGLFSLMIADSCKHLIHAGVAGWLLFRRIGWLKGENLPTTTLKALAASLLMGGVAAVVQGLLVRALPLTTIGELVVVVGTTGAGALVFALAAWILRIREFSWLIGLLRQRLR